MIGDEICDRVAIGDPQRDVVKCLWTHPRHDT
jgi:hypothetical protein